MTDDTLRTKMHHALQDALLEIDPSLVLTSKNMFGGAGFWIDGVIVGVWTGGTLALKLANADKNDLIAAGGGQNDIFKGYAELPDGWIEQPDLIVPWLEKSITHVQAEQRKKRRK